MKQPERNTQMEDDQLQASELQASELQKSELLESELLDAELETALRNFRTSVHRWSAHEYARPRTVQRSRWSGFWQTMANPIFASALVAVLLVASVGIPVEVRRQRAIAQEAAQQAAIQSAIRSAQLAQQRQAEELAAKAAAAADAMNDEEFLNHVDSDIAQATPEAFEPLASLMSDSTPKDR